jgi:TRAP-type C4-dicarboxylate transport system permease small subunit
MKSIVLPLIYFVISLLFSLLLIAFSHKYLEQKLKKLAGLSPASYCFNVLAAGLLLSMGLIMSEASRPMMTVINYLSRSMDNMWIIKAGGYIGLLFILVVIFSALIIIGSVMFFNKMTGSMDEVDEIKKGNVGIAILLSALMIAMTLFLKAPIISLLESIVPMPVSIY